jgi:HEAT repeat protein
LAVPLLAWVERTQPGGLAAQLDLGLASDAAAPSTGVRARGLLPGGVAGERLAALLADPSPARRAAAASVAEAGQRDRLRVLAQGDPAAEVRSTALQRLVQLEGFEALEPVVAAFSDREAAVRGTAAQLAAGLGADAIPRVSEVARGWPSPAPETAVLALDLSTAPAAREALRALADGHADERVRGLAALALGKPMGDAH